MHVYAIHYVQWYLNLRNRRHIFIKWSSNKLFTFYFLIHFMYLINLYTFQNTCIVRVPVVDWFCLFIYLWVWLSLWKIVRSSVILLLPLFIMYLNNILTSQCIDSVPSWMYWVTGYAKLLFYNRVTRCIIKTAVS